jgi:hypothetical protein
MPLSAISSLLDALLYVGFIADGISVPFSAKTRAKLRQRGRGFLVSAIIFAVTFWLAVILLVAFAISFYLAIPS